MMRRGFSVRLAARPMNDWSTIDMAKVTTGKVFDTTILDKGLMPTFALQSSLFRLPIPKLDDTCKRYLDSVKPLVTPDAFAKTSKYVADFQSKDGKRLHDELVANDKANPSSSFISDDWFDLYLRDRQPLPINYNPALITRRDPDKKDGLVRAAYWIASTCRWNKMLLDCTLKPDIFFFCGKDHYCRKDWFLRTVAMCPDSFRSKLLMFGSQFMAFPLDMSQYNSALNSTRVPKKGRDEIVRSGFLPHIVVNYRGHQFKVTVADAQGSPLSESQIYARLRQIVDLNPTAPAVDVGVFTADQREQWAEARINLEMVPENKLSLETIDSAILCLNLDLDTTADLETCQGAIASTRQLLVSKSNRWWDKSISVTATRDGTIGVSFEHAWGDGVAVLRYCVDVFNDSISRSSSTLERNVAATEPVQQLRWVLNEPLIAVAKKAEANLVKEIQRMDFFPLAVETFGKADAIFKGKSQAKPDPFMQVAMQLAWWRLNHSTVSTYESASTAAFKKGRTECIRSATLESQKFTLIFDDAKTSDSDKVAAMIAAMNKHAQISKDAKMGNGIDRHLFALKKLAGRTQPPLSAPPAIFEDPSYNTFGSNILSTSSLFSEALVGGGFGPVSAGYGIGYAAADDKQFYNISCWNANGPQHTCAEFGEAIYIALHDMRALLKKAAPSA